MTTQNPLPDHLEVLGDALREAARADLARQDGDARRRVRRRRTVAVLAAAVIGIPGVAVAANALISNDEVQRSIPKGTLVLMDTKPTCTTVREGVEFDCKLANKPQQGDVEAGGWKGTVEPTVDDTDHVNGGCRSLDADGTHWRCYVGQEAVKQQIIGPDFLGEKSSGPGVG